MTTELSAAQVATYDRQIRLFGATAQRAISSARVLVGGLGPLGAEVAKNLILAGVSVTLADSSVVCAGDAATFLVDASADAGRNRAEASLARAADLNPLATVSALAISPSGLADVALGAFQAVVLCGGGAISAISLCARCRKQGVPVITAEGFGWWGAFFQDAGPAHSYERAKAGTAGGTGGGDVAVGGGAGCGAGGERCVSAFRSLSSVLEGTTPPSVGSSDPKALPPYAAHVPKHSLPFLYAWLALHSAALRGTLPASAVSNSEEVTRIVGTEASRLCSVARVEEDGRVDAATIAALVTSRGSEVALVAAVLGGIIGNEVVKLITHKDAPLNNLLIFDAMGGEGGRLFCL